MYQPGKRILGGFLILFLLWGIWGCTPLTVGAETRVFETLNLSLLDRYELPQQSLNGTTVGGLSALAYDPQSAALYALSDDRSAPHVYTFSFDLNRDGEAPTWKEVQVESVTFLKDEAGEPFEPDVLDPEGLVLTPQGTWFVSSEGIYAKDTPPQILEFDLETGYQVSRLPIPTAFQVAMDPETRRQQTGVQSNLGFESLTSNPTGSLGPIQEPLRLFAMNESPLIQDLDVSVAEEGGRLRLLHYYLSDGPPLLIASHLYPLSSVPLALFNGVSEILALDNNGHFFTLERAVNPFGFKVQIFQAAIAGATDISNLESLQGELGNVNPVQKQLVYSFDGSDGPVGNFEGMTFGPRLPDGSRSLILVSDNNFDSAEPTELLLFQINMETNSDSDLAL